ncbi:hypothetical protein U8607_05375 [Methylobacterium durans]|uniref:hypothetical protein n=1 Tax=Methylobacterium durans TaxID=2202825 RepID=UPI002AFDFA3B|nr:hypothetical protein [Methylobacterium durans]MEA1831510.1 hypothetical protein [Methylobacterium durans]
MLGVLTLGAGLAAGTVPAPAADFFEPYDEVPPPVVTRRPIVERPIVLPPRRVVREVIVERPVVYRPPYVVREIIVDAPVVYPPGPYIPAEVQARIGLFETRFGPRPIPYAGIDPLD